MKFDEKYFQNAYRLFHREPEIVNLRALGAPIGKNKIWSNDWSRGVISGFYDNAEAFGRDAFRLSQMRIKGIYHTLQIVRPELLARSANRLSVPGKNESVSDKHIIFYRWVLLDIDRAETFGVSASAPEIAQLKKVRNAVLVHLKKLGITQGIKVFSGNGFHIFIRTTDTPANDETASRIKNVLTGLSTQFSTDAVNIDCSVWNPARIVKVPGTVARKADDIPARPHRHSHLEHKKVRTLDDIPEYPLF